MNYLANELYEQITKNNKKNQKAENLSASIIDTAERMRQLKRSVVFTLPDQGNLFGEREMGKSIMEKYGFVLENFRLPYPETVLEFELSNRNRLNNLENASVYDALVLLLREVELGIEMVIFFRLTKKKVWDLCNFGCTLTDKSEVIPLFVTRGSDQIHLQDQRVFLSDINGEVTTVYEFLAALQCNNVKESAALGGGKRDSLNKQRKNNQKAPLFDYKVLTIPGHRTDTRASKGGSHTPPRTHLRRGHIRRLASGKVTWVNACVVRREFAREGVVTKDYAVDAV